MDCFSSTFLFSEIVFHRHHSETWMNLTFSNLKIIEKYVEYNLKHMIYLLSNSLNSWKKEANQKSCMEVVCKRYLLQKDHIRTNWWFSIVFLKTKAMQAADVVCPLFVSNWVRPYSSNWGCAVYLKGCKSQYIRKLLFGCFHQSFAITPANVAIRRREN